MQPPLESTYSCELFPTLITPFLSDGSIDYPSVERLIRLDHSCGSDGIFAVCQSSEMFFLSDEEKLELAAFCIRLCRKLGIRCVVSGHTQKSEREQKEFLLRMAALEPDALILVLNRFADENESDEMLLSRMNNLLAQLPENARLGMYECPYPYKRLLTPVIIERLISDGRFRFVKDTCCDADLIRERLAMLNGSKIGLYNANMATLLDSLVQGARGYSGVILNFFPELLGQLKQLVTANPPRMAKAERAAESLTLLSALEYQNYPSNAKYCMQKRGLIGGVRVRNGRPDLSKSQRLEMDAAITFAERERLALIPQVDRELLFEANTYFLSCHASTVLPLPSGTVLAAYFAGDAEKADNVGIYLSRRENGAWQSPRRIAKVFEVAHWNPVLFWDGEQVRIVFKVGREIPEWRSYTMSSKDGGISWSQPAPLPEANFAGGPVRCKPIRLSDNSLLAPNSDETADGTWTVRVDRALCAGGQFERFADIPLNLSAPQRANYIRGGGAIQPTLWESTPGKVHALLRTTSGFIFRSDSADGGRTWCEAYNTGLPNNNSGIDVEKAGDALYLVMNPVSGNWAGRTPLLIQKSTDNGHTFSPQWMLENQLFDPSSDRPAEFSYPAMVHQGGALYVTYTHLRKRIAFARIDLNG